MIDNMAEAVLTDEFSLCLTPTPEITERVEALRRELPPSPYRDDPPHLTLLRGIRCWPVGNERLLECLAPLVRAGEQLPQEAVVVEAINGSNAFYRPSGVISLAPSPGMSAYRGAVIERLLASDFSIE